MFRSALVSSALMAVVLAVPVVAAGQSPAPAPARQDAVTEPKLPVSLERIKRQLREQSVTETTRFEDFQLITSMHVYGQAPRFELFEPVDPNGVPSSVGPVRYGGMTHAEFLQQVTPRNFQAPVMNLSGAAFSLTNWIADKRREAQRKKEAERRRSTP